MAFKFPGACLFASLQLWEAAAALGGGPLRPVTQSEELAMIQQALEKSPEFADAVKGKKKVVASTMVRYRDKPAGDNTESEFVETLHFVYDTGRTIRTVYNLTDKKVAKLETLEAYPTPLAEEEITEARKLAADKDERVKALLQKYKENEITVGALAPVVAERKNKDFGKRIAILQLQPKEKLTDTVTVTVNLTDQTVSRE